jgi:predicted DNA-binding protein (MmcQ/YjbR family)
MLRRRMDTEMKLHWLLSLVRGQLQVQGTFICEKTSSVPVGTSIQRLSQDVYKAVKVQRQHCTRKWLSVLSPVPNTPFLEMSQLTLRFSHCLFLDLPNGHLKMRECNIYCITYMSNKIRWIIISLHIQVDTVLLCDRVNESHCGYHYYQLPKKTDQGILPWVTIHLCNHKYLQWSFK